MYCCDHFRESVTEGKIEKANDSPDETEWLLPEWLHIYYCPFCGSFIKGEGFGSYHEEAKKLESNKEDAPDRKAVR